MKPSEAAKIIGCTTSGVHKLIKRGKIKVQKHKSTNNRHGYEYDVSDKEVKRIRNAPKTVGRPRKPKPGRSQG